MRFVRLSLLAAAPLVILVALWCGSRNEVVRGIDYYSLAERAPIFSPLEGPLKFFGVIGPKLIEVEPGVVLYMDPRDFIARDIVMNGGNRERMEWEWILSRLKPGVVFIDVGAHIGTYSIRAAKALSGRGKVIAFEPNPETIEKLRAGIAASGLNDTIDVKPVALGDKPGKLRLYSSAYTNTGMTSFTKQNAAKSGMTGREFEVDVVRMDDVLSSIERVDLIKIDVEGAESIVLRGAAKLIAKYRPTVVIETIETQARAAGSSSSEIESILTSYGLRKIGTTEDNALWVAQ